MRKNGDEKRPRRAPPLLHPWQTCEGWIDYTAHCYPHGRRHTATVHPKTGGACATMLNSSSRNVLFIAVDDLRPNLGAYGHSFMHTPRMDELADSGTLFQRAYAQYAFCAPSRNSFMTGRRPDVTRAYSFMNHFRESGVGRNWLSFPQYFRSAGYWAAGAGKLYHPGMPHGAQTPDRQTSNRSATHMSEPRLGQGFRPISTRPTRAGASSRGTSSCGAATAAATPTGGLCCSHT